jgi:hypothetical protein
LIVLCKKGKKRYTEGREQAHKLPSRLVNSPLLRVLAFLLGYLNRRDIRDKATVLKRKGGEISMTLMMSAEVSLEVGWFRERMAC